jgi:hypothetical protein
LTAACWILVGCALAPLQASIAKLETRWMVLDAKVSVGADGRVADVVLLDDKVSAAIKATVVDNVKRWQFAPVLANGVAAPALTYVRFDVCAIPSGDGYDLAIKYIDNGPLLARAMGLEFSPSIAEYSNDLQSVRIKLRVMPDSSAQLQDVVMVDVAPMVQRDIRGTIAAWVGSMQFLPEQIGGQPVATNLEWPLELRRDPLGQRYKTHSQNFDPKNDPACKSARAAATSDKPHAIDSPLKLRDDAKAAGAEPPAK